MNTVSKILLSTVISTSFLTGCSNAPVQTGRLNTVENLLYDAERVLKLNSVSNPKQYAKENLDTASAYLLTLRDNKKVLSDSQLKKYNTLSQRVLSLQKQLN